MAKNANSQNAKVTINKQDVRLESILSEIESQTNYLFIYKKNVDVNLHKSISVKATPVIFFIVGVWVISFLVSIIWFPSIL